MDLSLKSDGNFTAVSQKHLHLKWNREVYGGGEVSGFREEAKSPHLAIPKYFCLAKTLRQFGWDGGGEEEASGYLLGESWFVSNPKQPLL